MPVCQHQNYPYLKASYPVRNVVDFRCPIGGPKKCRDQTHEYSCPHSSDLPYIRRRIHVVPISLIKPIASHRSGSYLTSYRIIPECPARIRRKSGLQRLTKSGGVVHHGIHLQSRCLQRVIRLSRLGRSVRLQRLLRQDPPCDTFFKKDLLQSCADLSRKSSPLGSTSTIQLDNVVHIREIGRRAPCPPSIFYSRARALHSCINQTGQLVPPVGQIEHPHRRASVDAKLFHARKHGR